MMRAGGFMVGRFVRELKKLTPELKSGACKASVRRMRRRESEQRFGNNIFFLMQP